MYGFVAALQAQTSIAFKERLRTIDLLIFDDAQFLQGKAIQAEFGHALNALLAAARMVEPHFEVSPTVLAFVARSIRSNGRDLEGAVNRLRAHCTPTSP